MLCTNSLEVIMTCFLAICIRCNLNSCNLASVALCNETCKCKIKTSKHVIVGQRTTVKIYQ